MKYFLSGWDVTLRLAMASASVKDHWYGGTEEEKKGTKRRTQDKSCPSTMDFQENANNFDSELSSSQKVIDPFELLDVPALLIISMSFCLLIQSKAADRFNGSLVWLFKDPLLIGNDKRAD
ncbi:hypothetical protein TNCV_2762191 [Trichonephila clavipes]|nr:hypothetical protein TNCV_2762191 [Trichonephila clavipes]